METASVPTTLGKNFDKSVKESAKMLATLKKQIVRLDPTLGGAVETAQKKIAFQLDKLKRKTGRAQAFKDGLIAAHQEFLESLLYPHKVLQSRELCFLPFLASWGMGGLKGAPIAGKQLQTERAQDFADSLRRLTAEKSEEVRASAILHARERHC